MESDIDSPRSRPASSAPPSASRAASARPRWRSGSNVSVLACTSTYTSPSDGVAIHHPPGYEAWAVQDYAPLCVSIRDLAGHGHERFGRHGELLNLTFHARRGSF